jgi:small subunit ribosomal protein S15
MDITKMIDKETIKKQVNEFGKTDADTGSTAVQVALLTTRIKNLTDHIGDNKKDYSTKLGLLKLVSQRKKLLKYLQRKDSAQYADVVKRLGLRK